MMAERNLTANHPDAHVESLSHMPTADAKDEPATAFYLHYGFISLPDSPQTSFLQWMSANGRRVRGFFTLSCMESACPRRSRRRRTGGGSHLPR